MAVLRFDHVHMFACYNRFDSSTDYIGNNGIIIKSTKQLLPLYKFNA